MQAEQIMYKYQVEVLTEQVRPGQRLLCFVVTYTALFHNITHVKSPDQLPGEAGVHNVSNQKRTVTSYKG